MPTTTITAMLVMTNNMMRFIDSLGKFLQAPGAAGPWLSTRDWSIFKRPGSVAFPAGRRSPLQRAQLSASSYTGRLTTACPIDS
ncbi:MAG: hypothetical protein KA148_16620 [Ottowia sp.]|nr:hypothetical protein [Ottowia sp.]